MPLTARMTDRTHSADGSKTVSQLHREHAAWADSQPTTTRCSVWGCDWTHDGTAAEGREAFLAHRAEEHPTADRIARNEERRIAAGEHSARAREHFEAQAEQRRRQLAGRRTRRRWTRESALVYLREVVERLGRVPVSTEQQELGLPGAGTQQRLFGGWSGYLRAAGFEPGHRLKDSSGEGAADLDQEEGPRSPTPGSGEPDEQQPGMRAPIQAATGAAGEAQLDARGASHRDPAATFEESTAERLGLDSLGSSDVARDLALVKSAVDEGANRASWIERLDAEADRLEVRCAAFRQIADGLRALERTEAA